MIKSWLLFCILIASTISDAEQSKNKRSITGPWPELSTSSSYSIDNPWFSNPNPWKNLKTTSDIYSSSSNIPKPPPVVITKEVRVPVDKFVPVEVAKFIPYPIEKIVEVPVEKIVRVPVDRIVRVPVDRIVRVPVEVPATPAPIPQMMAVAQAPPMPIPAPVAMPVQQQMPLMIRPGIPYTIPILITAQGLSISTSGLVAPPGTVDQTSAPTSAVALPPLIQAIGPQMMQPTVQSIMQPVVQPMVQRMIQPMAPPSAPSMAPLAPVSNNSTVGISFIINGLAAQRFPQGIHEGLSYVNTLPDVAPEPIQGNSLDLGILESLIKNGGGIRWKRNTESDDTNK